MTIETARGVFRKKITIPIMARANKRKEDSRVVLLEIVKYRIDDFFFSFLDLLHSFSLHSRVVVNRLSPSKRKESQHQI